MKKEPLKLDEQTYQDAFRQKAIDSLCLIRESNGRSIESHRADAKRVISYINTRRSDYLKANKDMQIGARIFGHDVQETDDMKINRNRKLELMESLSEHNRKKREFKKENTKLCELTKQLNYENNSKEYKAAEQEVIMWVRERHS